MMRVLSQWPLRIKLSLLMVVLLSAGLLVSSVIATRALSDFLIDRVDESMAAGTRALSAETPPGGPQPTSDRFRPPSRFYIALIDAEGTASAVISTPDDAGGATPALPSATQLIAALGEPFTVGSVGGGGDWRVSVSSSADGLVVVAASLADVQATVNRLVLLQLVVGAIVVIVAAIVGYLVVRRSLRPLDEISAAAREIAEGDLSLRVPHSGEGTEVDQLAMSFNSMVIRIEESFVAQRSSEIQARESEDRMRRFVADAGHELRTPLTSIRGYAELIEDGAAPDRELAVSRIQDEAKRMGLLVDDLLMLARLDEHRPLELESVDVGALVQDAVSGVLVGAPDRRIHMRLPPAESVIVTGDRDRLRQVFDNLLSNALRYSAPDALVDVTVGGDAEWCSVVVADSGVGLTQDEAGRVFERLYRTDDARNRVSGGTGLGLAIVRSVVEAHGGSVAVASERGVGSTFTVRLPVRR